MTWGKQNTEAEAHEQLSYALDQGINFLDSAEVPLLTPLLAAKACVQDIVENGWFSSEVLDL